MCGFSLACRILLACALTLGVLAGAAAGEQNESSARPLQHAAISAGGSHACAIDRAGAVRCWGQDALGQLGNGGPLPGPDALSPSSPLFLDGPASALALGDGSSCVLLAGGGVRCWGADTSGQLGNGAPLEATASPMTPVQLGGPAVGITVGSTHACALMLGAAVRCWGADESGQLGDGGPIPGAGTAIPAGLVALGQPALAITAGDAHTCALLGDASVRCWGADADGQLGDGSAGDGSSTPSTPVALGGPAVAISAGGTSTCALLADGSVRCWGADDLGQLGDGGPIPGAAKPVPATVALGQPAQAVSVGDKHACALIADGTVRCWGANTVGQLGDGGAIPGTTTSAPSTPVALGGPARAVTAAGAGACALLSEGTLRCWGADGDGQLGDGTPAADRSAPAEAVGLPPLGSPDSADLAVGGQASATTAQVGAAVTMTFTVTNQGVDTATAAVAAPLGDGLRLVAATASQGSYATSTGRWSAGPVAPGASATLTLAATAAAPGTSTTTAEVVDSTARDPDSAPANDVAEDDRVAITMTVTAAPTRNPAAAVAPDALTLRLAPGRDRRAPFAFVARGRLIVTRTALREACAGRVVITARAGRRVVQRTRAALKLAGGDCAYSARLAFARRPAGGGRLAITARFAGTDRLTARAAPRPVTARLG
jgi:uncharacterized repeat protein (TIGR01451 family)